MLEFEFEFEEMTCWTGVGVIFSLSADWVNSAILWLGLSPSREGGVTCDCMAVGEDVGFAGKASGMDGIRNSCWTT